MPYMDDKAPGRFSVTETIMDDIRQSTVDKSSNQEQIDGSDFGGKVTPPVGSVAAKFNTGNQVQYTANTKLTGRLGVPARVAESAKDFNLPAVQNPDGSPNRPNRVVAPKSK